MKFSSNKQRLHEIRTNKLGTNRLGINMLNINKLGTKDLEINQLQIESRDTYLGISKHEINKISIERTYKENDEINLLYIDFSVQSHRLIEIFEYKSCDTTSSE